MKLFSIVGVVHLVNIIVMECSRPSEGRAQIYIEVIQTPKSPLTALLIDIVNRLARPIGPLSVHPKSQGKMRDGTEQSPAMVETRVRQQVEALGKASLDASEANNALFTR